jgi:hypothetical protein
VKATRTPLTLDSPSACSHLLQKSLPAASAAFFFFARRSNRAAARAATLEVHAPQGLVQGGVW